MRGEKNYPTEFQISFFTNSSLTCKNNFLDVLISNICAFYVRAINFFPKQFSKFAQKSKPTH